MLVHGTDPRGGKAAARPLLIMLPLLLLLSAPVGGADDASLETFAQKKARIQSRQEAGVVICNTPGACADRIGLSSHLGPMALLVLIELVIQKLIDMFVVPARVKKTRALFNSCVLSIPIGILLGGSAVLVAADLWPRGIEARWFGTSARGGSSPDQMARPRLALARPRQFRR